MVTLGYLLDQYIDNTRDDSSENTQRGINKINSIQKLLCASNNYHFLESEYDIPTQTGVGIFSLPRDYRKMLTVSQTYGTREWPIEEFPDPKGFNKLFYLSTTMSAFVAQYYHIRGKNLMIFPFCSNSTDKIKMFYLKNVKRMEQLDYTEGLISVDNGNTSVVGTGTNWLINVVPGASLIIDDVDYYIKSIESDTALTLDQPYQGASVADYAYIIGDIPTIPEPYTDILWVGAVKEYWGLYKKDEVQTKEYKDLFKEYEQRLLENTAGKTVEDFIKPRKSSIWNPNMYPTVTASLP